MGWHDVRCASSPSPLVGAATSTVVCSSRSPSVPALECRSFRLTCPVSDPEADEGEDAHTEEEPDEASPTGRAREPMPCVVRVLDVE